MLPPCIGSTHGGMTVAQATVFWIGLGCAITFPPLFYPGVRKFADSSKDSWIASTMAGLLCAAFVALVAGYIVNAAVQIGS